MGIEQYHSSEEAKRVRNLIAEIKRLKNLIESAEIRMFSAKEELYNAEYELKMLTEQFKKLTGER